MIDREITSGIISCAIKVHKQLGPGLLESAYEACLAHEMAKAGIGYEQQKPMPVIYDDLRLDAGYRVDLFVENKVIVELKAVEMLNDVHLAQVMTYLRLANCRFGLLINFNVTLLKDGIRRVINGY